MAKNPIALLWAWLGPGDQDYEAIGGRKDGSVNRLLVSSKTVVTPPTPPAGASEVVIDASDPLYVGPQPLYHETEHTIANTKTFYLQFISAGGAGDPAEKGAMVEVFYDDGVDRHIVERIFVQSDTIPMSLDDVTLTRNGTTMVGDGTAKIVVRREQLSKAGEIDAVVRGYEQ